MTDKRRVSDISLDMGGSSHGCRSWSLRSAEEEDSVLLQLEGGFYGKEITNQDLQQDVQVSVAQDDKAAKGQWVDSDAFLWSPSGN